MSRTGRARILGPTTKPGKAPSAQLPDPLLRAVREKKLVIFAGAGVSMLAPSSLPDWWQFNEVLLDEAKSQALAAGTLDVAGRAALGSLSLEDIGVTTFSEAIVKIVAGDSYFPALQVLDSDRTNANHQAMADLARQGTLHAIVTTNFDTLIERAFAEAGVPLQIAVSEEAFSRQTGDGDCTLHKVHGSVTDATTLVDTVGQKLRGLPAFVRFGLARLFVDHHVLVLGYSGADLDFGNDYLSFSSVSSAGPGLTWGVRPGTPPSARAAEVVGRAGSKAAIYEAKLPDLFYQLGAQNLSRAETAEAEERSIATERTRASIAPIFAAFGARNSLALCMRLLADAGRTDAAALLHAALGADIGSPRHRLASNDGPAIRALAVTADLLGDTQSAGVWKRLELKHLEGQLRSWRRLSKKAAESLVSGPGRTLADQALPYPFHGNFTAEGWRQLDRQMRAELERLLAGAWTNLAIDALRQGKTGEAGKALERSLDYCELSGDRAALAAMLSAYADWSRFLRGDPDDALAWATIAEVAGLVAGNVDGANAAALIRAEISLLLGEYDVSLAALDRIRKRKPFGLSLEMLVETARLTGIIEVRRGKPTDALATWRQALASVATSVVLVARIRWTIIANLSYAVTFRSELLEECDKLLVTLGERRMLAVKIAGVPSVDEVKNARRGLASKEGRLPDFFEPWSEVEGDPVLNRQQELWQALVQSEATNDQATILFCLRSLGWQLYEIGKVPRAREVAFAYLATAERAGDVMEQVGAKWLLGNALYALGDNAGARDIFAGLNAIQFAGDPEIERRVSARLAELDSDPQPRHFVLDMIEIVEGRESRPRSADEGEALARRALDGREHGIVRVVALEVLGLRRLTGDENGMARCYDMLAEAAVVEGRKAQATKLRARARELR